LLEAKDSNLRHPD